MTHDEIEKVAYELWQQRGCPIGSPEEDWFRAEEMLQKEEPLERQSIYALAMTAQE